MPAAIAVVRRCLQSSGQVSLKGYQKYELRFSAPHSLGGRYFADARATYRNYSQEAFFGMGNDTRSENRANYRLEDTYYGGQAGIHLHDHVKAGAHLGWI